MKSSPTVGSKPIGIVVLAAGASTRMGTPKQELRFRGQTLLQHAVQVALATDCGPIVVVTGAVQELTLPKNFIADIQLAHNPDWEQGMGASIRCGLSSLLATNPHLSAALLMVCDQPFVELGLLQRLLDTRQHTGASIVASHYEGTEGTPVLFDQAHFAELLQLAGKGGAKSLLRKHREQVASVPFPAGAFDVDTPADYDSLKLSE